MIMNTKDISQMTPDEIFDELKGNEEKLRKTDSLNDATASIVKRSYQLSVEYKKRLVEIKDSLDSVFDETVSKTT